ncbi:MAG: type II toxin-antitoxin system PrlF family antitoxin [Proteobacteria bacterium]|nr:type II toxin-antitoxin system PrlF family antitoxin [Pseudomonadota bacterium]
MNKGNTNFQSNARIDLETTLTQKGQVTIPLPIRRALKLKPRDRVVFELEGDTVRIKPFSSRLLAGFGAVKPHRRPEDFSRVRAQFEKAVAEEVTKRK